MNLTELNPEIFNVYVASAIIALMLMGFGIKFEYDAYLIRRELSATYKAVEKLLRPIRTINLEAYDTLSNIFATSKVFSHHWNEFHETVIKDDSESEVQIYNVKSFSEFFSKDALIDKHLNGSFWRKVPGVITSLGLFFTFLFIVIGLGHLEVQASGKVDGVGELVRGLSAKFVSSLLAILCALTFTFLESVVIREIEGRYQKLIDLLDEKFQKKTGEDYLRSIDRNMRELNFSMKRFSTDLALVIREGLQEGMRPSTDRLLMAIENLEKQKSENIADTLAGLISDFKSSLNQGTSAEFNQLGASIGKLAVTMNESANRSDLMSSRMENIVAALDKQVQKHESTSDTSVQKLHEGFSILLKTIEDNTRIQSENLNKLLTDIVEKTSLATSGLVSNVSSLSERNTSLMSNFGSLNEGMMKSVEKYQSAVHGTESLIKNTSDLANNLGSTLSQLSAVQSKIDSTFQQYLSESTIIQGIQKGNAESVEKFQRVFKEVEGGLSTVLDQIGMNLQKYNELTRTGLEGYLKQYDESLSISTVKLSSTVGDLHEVLEGLGDQLESLQKAVTLKAG